MLIRTQDKKAIIDILRMTIKLDPEDKNTIIAYSNHNAIEGWEILGTYSSEEKAMKVLDMIQKEYEKPIYRSKFVISSINKVFEMPEDSEVDV